MSKYKPIKHPFSPSPSTLELREVELPHYEDIAQRPQGRNTKELGGWTASRSTQFGGDLFLALIPIFFIGKNGQRRGIAISGTY